MKKKEIKNLASKIAEYELDDNLSDRKKQEIIADMMKDLTPREMFEIYNYIDKIIERKKEIINYDERNFKDGLYVCKGS